MTLPVYHNDKTIKIEYDPTLNLVITELNKVGATDSATLRTLDFTPSDINSVYVAKTGSDLAGNGTLLTPYASIKKAFTAITVTRCNGVVLDSGLYIEDSQEIPVYCARIVAAIGQAPVIQPKLVYNENYFIDEVKATTALASTAGSSSRVSASAALSNGNSVIVYDYNGASYYTYFIIIDKDGSIVKSETLVSGSNALFPSVCSLESGHFVITYRDMGNNTLAVYVYNNDGSLSYSENSKACSVACYKVGRVGGYDDRFVVIYCSASNNTYFVVMNISGSVFIAPTVLFNYGNYVWISTIKAGTTSGFVFTYVNGNNYESKLCVVDGSGVLQVNQVVATNCYANDCLINTAGSEPTVIIANGDSSGNVSLVEYSLDDYSIVTSSQTIHTFTGATFYGIKILKTRDNSIIVSGYINISSVYSTFLLAISSDWVLISSETFSGFRNSSCVYNDITERVLVAMTSASSPYSPNINIKGGFLTDWWTASSSIEFNGITFDNTEDYIHKFIYVSAGASFSMKWCTVQNVTRDEYTDDETYPLIVIQSLATANSIENCKVYNSDRGFQFTSNTVTVKNSQFFKNLVGPAIYVDGAGTGIIINHCDFIMCNYGVRLENNAGSEVIKNSIFWRSIIYDIYAEAAITFINSTYSGALYNATAGYLVVNANPHYCDDGYTLQANLNLRLKSRSIGYQFDSPARFIADDLKNAGSLEISTAGSTETWTSITISKVKVALGYEPVGPVETGYGDGDVDSSVDSFTEVLELDWSAILNADLQKLLTFIFTKVPRVRIYLDPVTNPNTYGVYKYIYDKVNVSPPHYALSRTGASNVSLRFKRAYNEGD